MKEAGGEGLRTLEGLVGAHSSALIRVQLQGQLPICTVQTSTGDEARTTPHRAWHALCGILLHGPCKPWQMRLPKTA